MIGLSTPTFDLDGAILIEELPRTDLGPIRRRVNRQRTLDGGVVVNDSGHAVGDRTIVVRWRIRSAEQLRAVQRLVQTYTRLTVCTREGAFTAAPEMVKSSGAEGDLTLLVVS
jgi:hypothetical protein